MNSVDHVGIFYFYNFLTFAELPKLDELFPGFWKVVTKTNLLEVLLPDTHVPLTHSHIYTVNNNNNNFVGLRTQRP